ncbi:MAG: hypothetical protein WDM87_10275 [Terracidiphilus sp.]
MVTFQIHLRAHVLFDDGLEIFSGGGPEPIGGCKILHRSFEARVPVLGRPHHHANHVQDESALGVDEVFVHVEAGFRRTETETHCDRTDIDGAEAKLVFSQ